MKETVLAIGGVAAAVTTIVNLVLLIWKPIHRLRTENAAREEKRDLEAKSIKETLELHTSRILENYLELLRHKIFSTTLPLDQKVNAGEKFVAAGGNGAAKIQHNQNVENLRKEIVGE